jgi:translation initiation factor 4A
MKISLCTRNTFRLSLDGVRQFYIDVEQDNYKQETLLDLYGMLNVTQSVIYCSSRSRIEALAAALDVEHFTVACFHSELPESNRKKLLSVSFFRSLFFLLF